MVSKEGHRSKIIKTWCGHSEDAMKPQERLAEKTFVSETERTFQHDDHLPSLPIPNLRQTLDKYLQSVYPVASSREYENTRRIVEQFEKGVGRQLHDQLLERNKHTRNWLQHWWLDYAYLYQREPIAPSLAFAGPFTISETLWPPGEGTQCQYLARYLYGVASFWCLLRRERLAPQRSRDGTALSMHQWRRLLSTTRLPGEHKDAIRAMFQTESEGCTPTHLVILCNGRLYTSPLLEPETERPLTIEEYQTILERVKEMAAAEPGPGLAALTMDNRTRWAENREYLRSLSPENAASLEVVESAVCHASLESVPGLNRDRTLRLNLCGDGSSRWADKSLTAVAYTDGYGGNYCDHSPMDAMTLVTQGWFSHLQELDFNRYGRLVVPVREHLCQPRELRFTVDERVRRDIQVARDVSRPLLNDVIIISRRYGRYGKLWIQTEGFHPDAFIQMALQLAYWSLHGRAAPTYETAATRRFYKARTETVRSCTPEALAWCRAMTSDSAVAADRRRLLRAAVDRHADLAKQASDGHGCDRHLMGLQILAGEAGLPTPDIFTDPMWKKSGGSGNFVLSTSTTGYTPCFGVTAAMVRDGYGCFYSIEPDRLNINISGFVSSQECDVNKFYDSVASSLDGMQQLMLSRSNL
ncbi:Peroxisomal carnitine O-octanoyltransferase [Amphibalanus amphitrite]|uniref:Peroxisomal carnitine O-octanoyltransferase n=1 Tax=Amphibalanus amphitrite TaxID=1232801 RepID=A0A6A4W5B9_AMPAM|nr:Peroxisomal carnitine O-octanoyltransferase [Amphibalanus amphitrite]